MSEKKKDLKDFVEDDMLEIEQLEAFLKERKAEMKRKEILKEYPPRQMSNGHWYIKIKGKKIERVKKESLEDAIVEYFKEDAQNLASLFDDYLAIRKMEVAGTTWQKDKLYFNKYIKNSKLGKIPLKQITIKDGYAFMQHCKEIYPAMKRKYWNNVSCMLNNMFQFAINEGLLERNPFQYLKPKKDFFEKKTFTRDSDTVFSHSEQVKVIALAEEDAVSSGSCAPYGIVLLFNLGLRDGELLALKWGDIEQGINGLFVHIQREMTASVNDEGRTDGYQVLDHCKTPTSDRRLPLNAKAIDTFRAIKALNASNGLPTGLDDFVMLQRGQKGEIKQINARGIDERLRKYCRKAGMDVIKSPHDIRRTAVTNLFRAGMPIKNIQAFAGHSSMKQTMDYIRLDDVDVNLMPFLDALADPAKMETDNVIIFEKPSNTVLCRKLN